MLDIVHNLVLPGMQAVCRSEGRAVFSENISNGWAGFGFSWESGMAAKCFHGLSKPAAEENGGRRLQ